MENMEQLQEKNFSDTETSYEYMECCGSTINSTTNPFSPNYVRNQPGNENYYSTSKCLIETNPFIQSILKPVKYSVLNNPVTLQNNSTSEEAIRQMSDSFLKALDIVSNRSTTVLPWAFHGHEHEDPVAFLQQLKQYFEKHHIVDDHHKVELAIDRLQGEAQEWINPYRSFIVNFGLFTERFLNRFNSCQVIAQATSKLYGEAQTDEPVEVFITRKCSLFQRLASTTPEYIKTSIILNQLRPEIRASLRSPILLSSTEELARLASSVEKDLHEVNNYNKYLLTSTTKLNHHGSEYNSNLNLPPSPCRYCQGIHFHKDCPRNPRKNSFISGNEQWAAGQNRTNQQRSVNPGRN